jgi:NADP-dependent 3-hydroxy acid dehydrogenase YdfG
MQPCRRSGYRCHDQQRRADAAVPLERLKIDDWDRTIDVKIKGVLYSIAAALPYIYIYIYLYKEQKAGHMINVSSVAGHKIAPGFAVYAATKHAVRALSEGLRQEVIPTTSAPR